MIKVSADFQFFCGCFCVRERKNSFIPTGGSMVKKLFVFLSAILISFQSVAFAAINIETRTGTLRLTLPDGSVQDIADTDPLPVIPDGAVIEVLSGIISVVVTGNDSVNLLAGGQSVVVGGGSTVNVSFEPTGAVILECAAGQVSVLAEDGSVAELTEGDQIRAMAGSTPEVLRGEVSYTDASGQTSNLTAEAQAETYNPPVVLNANTLDLNIQNEETAADTSPVTP